MRKKRRQTRKRRGKLNPADIERGIYIDFEGVTGRHPVLLGVLFAPDAQTVLVRQTVISSFFGPAAEATGCATADLEKLARGLADQAKTEGRYLIAWSEHDLEVVGDYCSTETRSLFASRYKNARTFCERWKETLHPEVAFDIPGRKTNALANYLDLIGYEVPTRFGPGMTGRNLRRLERPMAAGKKSTDLSDAQPSCWTDVLGHNQHDCVGMFEVCHRAAMELEASPVRTG